MRTLTRADGTHMLLVECDQWDEDRNCIHSTFRIWGMLLGDGGHVWIWQPEDVITNACAYLPHNLTRAEWEQFIGDAMPYQAVCDNLPIEPEATTTPTVAP